MILGGIIGAVVLVLIVVLFLVIPRGGNVDLSNSDTRKEFVEKARDQFSNYDGTVKVEGVGEGEGMSFEIDFKNKRMDVTTLMNMTFAMMGISAEESPIQAVIYDEESGSTFFQIDGEWRELKENYFGEEFSISSLTADMNDEIDPESYTYEGTEDCTNGGGSCYILKNDEEGTLEFNTQSELLVYTDTNGSAANISYGNGTIEIPSDATEMTVDELGALFM